MNKQKSIVYFSAGEFIKSFAASDSVKSYDILKAAVSLQGIVNKKRPRLFIEYCENRIAFEVKGISGMKSDEFWIKELQKKGNYLHGKKIIRTDDFFELFDCFEKEINGWCLWDDDVPATANLAATAAGALNLLPLRNINSKNSFTKLCLERFPEIKVKLDFSGMFTGSGIIPGTKIKSTGSKKCDTYIWGIEKFMKPGLCSSALFANFADGIKWTACAPHPDFKKESEWNKSPFTDPYPDLGNAGIPNSDYYISRRAFFFDLQPWLDETASDEPEQPAGIEGKTIRMMLETANKLNKNDEVINVGGFIPWWIKYCNIEWEGKKIKRGKRGGVPTEWESIDMYSAYNAFVDADAYGLIGYGNASVYSRIPLAGKLKNYSSNKKIEDKIYIMTMMGDYDSAAWLSQMPPVLWNDRKDPKIPLAWSINPVLAERAPHVFNYLAKTRKKTDSFGAQEGAGYLNMNYLSKPRFQSDLPDGTKRYATFADKWFSKTGISHTLFTIFTNSGNIRAEAAETFREFSKAGVGIQQGRALNKNINGTPFICCRNDYMFRENPEVLAGHYADHIRRPVKRGFYFFRTILISPETVSCAAEIIKKQFSAKRYEMVGVADFYALLKKHYAMVEKEAKKLIAGYAAKFNSGALELLAAANKLPEQECGPGGCSDLFIPVEPWKADRKKANLKAAAEIKYDSEYLCINMTVQNSGASKKDLYGSWMVFINLPEYDWGTKWMFVSDGKKVHVYAGEILCTFHPLEAQVYYVSKHEKKSGTISTKVYIPWERLIDPFIEYPDLKAKDIASAKKQFSLVLNDKHFPGWEKEMFFGQGPRPEQMLEIEM